MPQGEELKGLLGALDAILTEQKEISSTLVLSRSRVDLQLKNVLSTFAVMYAPSAFAVSRT